MMEHDWRLPISMQGKKSWEVAHYMPVSERTDQLHPAICGHVFNPGFAKPAKKVRHCFNCERRLK